MTDRSRSLFLWLINAVVWALLLIGAFSMLLPFIWMLSTSLKADQYVLAFPPEFWPREGTFASYQRLAELFPIGRLFLNSLAWGLSGYLLVAAGGLHLGSLPGGLRLWPVTWNPAYQAALFSLILALVPVGPTLARSIRDARSAPKARGDH